jgi:hypothetical protein
MQQLLKIGSLPEASPLGLEGNPFALILRGTCTVDTWQNGTARRLTKSHRETRTAIAWHRKGRYVAHAVSDLCRVIFAAAR